MLARKVLMVSPDHFGFNHDTASDNFFQKSFSLSESETKNEAQKEFLAFKSLLENAGIEVVTFSPQYTVPCPDAVFPNNWFCKPSKVRLLIMNKPVAILQRCAIKLRLLAAHLPRRCIISKRRDSAPRSRAPSGQRINDRWN